MIISATNIDDIIKTHKSKSKEPMFWDNKGFEIIFDWCSGGGYGGHITF